MGIRQNKAWKNNGPHSSRIRAARAGGGTRIESERYFPANTVPDRILPIRSGTIVIPFSWNQA